MSTSDTPAEPSQPLPPQAPVAPPGYPQWQPAWGSPVAAPSRQHSAWIRTMTPLTAGLLSLLLIAAGFGLGVVVGWQHDDHGPQRIVFQPGQHRFQEPRGLGQGQGPYFNGPNRQRPTKPAPTPSATS